MKLRHLSTAFLATCLLLVCSEGQAAVTVTGDVQVCDGIGTVTIPATCTDEPGVTDPWEIDDRLYVGKTGEGTLSVEAGGVVSVGPRGWGSHIGYSPGSVGTVTVSGEGSEWNNTGEIYVGNEGEGSLNITDGGVVSSAWSIMGYQSGSVGTVTVTGDGSEWANTGPVDVGIFGEGTLNITDGGVVSGDGSYVSISPTHIGYFRGSVGTVTVTDEGSEWNNSGWLLVGRYGEGTLNIESDGVVSNSWGNIGYSSHSVGTVTVTGEGSEWNNSENLMVGPSFSSTFGGDGTLNITGGGTVNVGEETWVALLTNSSGVINFNNGTLNTGGLTSSLDNLQGTGTINTHGLVSDIDLLFDHPSSLSQSFTLDDPGQNISLNLEVDGTANMGVGYEGTGLLQISGGVKVESSNGFLGYKAGSSGTAFVVGEGSHWNNSPGVSTSSNCAPWDKSGCLYVGREGEGTLNIMDGGVVSNTKGYIGWSSDSVGTVTVNGEGSEWNNGFNLSVKRGTLTISDSGVVNVAETTTFSSNSTLHIELSDPTSGPSLITDDLELIYGGVGFPRSMIQGL